MKKDGGDDDYYRVGDVDGVGDGDGDGGADVVDMVAVMVMEMEIMLTCYQRLVHVVKKKKVKMGGL